MSEQIMGDETVSITPTEVRYERLKNLGNYENEKVGIVVQVPDGTDPTVVVAYARQFVANQLSVVEDLREQQERLYRLHNKIDQTQRHIDRLALAWRTASEVLVAHDITPETHPELRWDWPEPVNLSAAIEPDLDDVPL